MPARLRRLLLSCLLIASSFLWLHAQEVPACPPNAQGFMTPRLSVGLPARVVAGGVPNRLRDAPSTSGTFLGQIAPSTELSVLAGPVCDAASGVVFWQVQAQDLQGWTAEGLDGVYFLEPSSPEGIATGQALVFQATQSLLDAQNARQATDIAQAATLTSQATLLAQMTAITRATQAVFSTQAAIEQATLIAGYTATPTPTLSPTPTLTPTDVPVQALPAERAVLNPDNLLEWQLASQMRLPYAASRILFAPDGSQVLFLVGSYPDNAFNLAFDLPSLTPSAQFMGYDLTQGVIWQMSPDAEWWLVLEDDVWMSYQARTGQSVLLAQDELSDRASGTQYDYQISGAPHYRLAISFGRFIEYAEMPRFVRVWSMASGAIEADLALDTPSIAFNRDGTRLALVGKYSPPRLWTLATGEERFPVENRSVSVIAYRPVPPSSGEQIAFYEDTQGLIISDLARGTRRVLATGRVDELTFSPDGDLASLISYTVFDTHNAEDGEHSVLDLETGQSRALGIGFFSAFNAQGDLLVSVDGYGRVSFWIAP